MVVRDCRRAGWGVLGAVYPARFGPRLIVSNSHECSNFIRVSLNHPISRTFSWLPVSKVSSIRDPHLFCSVDFKKGGDIFLISRVPKLAFFPYVDAFLQVSLVGVTLGKGSSRLCAYFGYVDGHVQ